jgi:hypothetical protein
LGVLENFEAKEMHDKLKEFLSKRIGLGCTTVHVLFEADVIGCEA